MDVIIIIQMKSVYHSIIHFSRALEKHLMVSIMVRRILMVVMESHDVTCKVSNKIHA